MTELRLHRILDSIASEQIADSDHGVDAGDRRVEGFNAQTWSTDGPVQGTAIEPRTPSPSHDRPDCHLRVMFR